MAVNKTKLLLTLFVVCLILEIAVYLYFTKLIRLDGIELTIALSISPVIFIIFLILVLTNFFPEKWIHDSYKM